MHKILLYLCCTLLFACDENVSENRQSESSHEHSHDHVNQSVTEEEMSCSNCGMETKDYPKWKAVITNGDRIINFCTPRCMFTHYLEHSAHLKNAKIQVTDYYSLKPVDAKNAYYVIHSNVIGPMGHDLVVVNGKTEAGQFMDEHEGEEVLDFTQVTDQVIQDLINH